MKKTLLLTSIVASMVAMAGTTGTLTVSSDSSTTVTSVTTDEVKGTKVTPKVVLDMKVKDTGFSFGGEYLFKETQIFKADHKGTHEGNIWAKYELPEIHGVKSYVKGTFNHEKNLIGELDLKYNYQGYMLGLNSETTVPLFGQDKLVTSTHTASVSKEKVSVLSDVKGSVAVKHAYKESAQDAKDAFKSVEVKAEAQYKEVKDLNVKGEVAVKYNKETGAEYKSINGLKTKATEASVLDTYKLTAEYKGVKNLTLTGVGEIKHFVDLVATPKHVVEYGLDLKADYMPIENLTLTANGLFYGQHNATGTTASNGDTVTNALSNNGYVKLVAGAKYDYKVTDKFTVTPEGTVAYTAANIDDVPATALSTLVLTPKVSAEYKVSNSLSLGGSVETPVKFSNVSDTYTEENSFGYKNTTVKTNLNLKYTW